MKAITENIYLISILNYIGFFKSVVIKRLKKTIAN